MTRAYAFCTDEIFQLVVSSLKRGITVMQLADMNKDNPDFPHPDSIYDYCNADNARKQIYTHAREMFADSIVDETIMIADTVKDPQIAANRIRARQWSASKLKPKVYGDKLDIDLNQRVDVSIAVQAARQRIGHNQLTSPLIEGNASVVEADAPDPFS